MTKTHMTNQLHEREEILNRAIPNADISRSVEEYFEVFDAFYAEDMTVSSEQKEEPISGKAQYVRSFSISWFRSTSSRKSAA